ncbi:MULTISPECIES: ParB N-terminal domain-containing protein [unclassified Megasphaera]|uniref:ParB N-terminal domain-containing protein n=1 Tax=unclassified Megasphaera TaxID=2626256 RepID=UPI0025BFA96F|nr:ParB N-terminal domain-containing protein [Megasphaera sp. UBA4233]
MQVIEKQVAELIPYENNPRHNEDAVKFVASSIQQFGFKVPIVISPDNVIIAGHTRVMAAKELGMDTVPCVIADDLTEEQMKAFRLADNKVTEASGWDWDKLEQELDDLTDFDMGAFGFDVDTVLDDTGEGSDGTINDFFEAAPDTPESEARPKESARTVTCPHCGQTFEI